MTPVRLEPAALRSRVKHSTTEPLRSQIYDLIPNMDLGVGEMGSFVYFVMSILFSLVRTQVSNPGPKSSLVLISEAKHLW